MTRANEKYFCPHCGRQVYLPGRRLSTPRRKQRRIKPKRTRKVNWGFVVMLAFVALIVLFSVAGMLVTFGG